MNNNWRITLMDTCTGEVYSEEIEYYGWPVLCEPYSGAVSGRMGMILRVEKILIPTQGNVY